MPRASFSGLAPLLFLVLAGCHGGGAFRTPHSVASTEPGLVQGEPPAVAEGPSTQAVTIVDRHPLLSKPRDYYESSGNNKVVKTAAATVIGIPAGIVGEVKQIVVGRPPAGY